MKKNQKILISDKVDDPAIMFILQAFSERKKSNSRYSVRAFANYLNVDHSLLSKVFKGKGVLSIKTVLRCLIALSAPKEIIDNCMREIDKKNNWENITDAPCEIIANWQYFALLELLSFTDIEMNLNGIAKRMGLKKKRVDELLRQLQANHYIKIDKDGNISVAKEFTTSYPQTDEVTKAMRLGQENLLLKSLQSLNEVSFDRRDHSSVVLALAEEDLPLYKEWIKDARRQLVKLFQKNKKFNSVYGLQISFFPLISKTEG